MTTGHKHRIIRIKEGGYVYRALRADLFHTDNLEWVDRSKMVFGPCASLPNCYYLSLLGAFHGLFGLTIKTKD